MSITTREPNPYRHYPNQPIVEASITVFDRGQLVKRGNSTLFKPNQGPEAPPIPITRSFDMVPLALADLDEALTPGTESRDKFERERALFANSTARNEPYGLIAVFPHQMADGSINGHLVRYPPADMWRMVQLVGASTLYRDHGFQGSFDEYLATTAQIVPGIIGCSVGSNIATTLFKIRPEAMKVADPKRPHPRISDRFPATYEEMADEIRYPTKAVVWATNANRIDPIAGRGISVYGAVDQTNIDHFINGTDSWQENEPQTTLVFEETDGVEQIKLDTRIACRDAGIDCFMITDIGPLALWEHRPFSVDQSLPLVKGIEDETILRAREALLQDPQNPQLRMALIFHLIGGQQNVRGEMRHLVGLDKGTEIPLTRTFAQDGATALYGSVIARAMILKMIGGQEKIPERALYHPLEGRIPLHDD